jgi:hypothetical protein
MMTIAMRKVSVVLKVCGMAPPSPFLSEGTLRKAGAKASAPSPVDPHAESDQMARP